MTNPTPHGQVPEALAHERDRAIMEGERNASLDAYSRVVLLTSAESRLYEAAFTNGWDRCAAHVQKPAEIEHVAGDVSKNGTESNMSTEQPAPAAQQAVEVPTRKQGLQVAVWVLPDGKGGWKFSWDAQDERFWVRLSAPRPSPAAQAAPATQQEPTE